MGSTLPKKAYAVVGRRLNFFLYLGICILKMKWGGDQLHSKVKLQAKIFVMSCAE